MTEDELNRKIEFVVEHQAQFFADITELKNAQAHTQKHIDHLTSLMTTLVERTLSNADAIQANAEAIKANTNAIGELSAIIKLHIQNPNGHTE